MSGIKKALFLAAAFFMLTAPVSDSPDRVGLYVDGRLVYYGDDFIFDDGSGYLPLRESASALGLDGFADSQSRTVFFRHRMVLIVVDSDKRLVKARRHTAPLSRLPIWTEDQVYVPEEVYTGFLSDLLGKEIKVEFLELSAGSRPAAPVVERPSHPSVVRNPVDVIVLDPGHGGSDPGARGPGGILEKDVTLTIAQKLKPRLEQEGLTVYLTRDGDTTVPLAERPRIAREKKADVFVSIHANGYKLMSAQGFETFFASLTATDQAALELAIWENQGELPVETPPEVLSDLELILGDMAQTKWLADSQRLAEMVQEKLARVMNSENRGVKQAPFRVLMDATMPAVLIEVGFLTSPQEAKMITDSETQEKIVEAIACAIILYRDETNARLGKSAPTNP